MRRSENVPTYLCLFIAMCHMLLLSSKSWCRKVDLYEGGFESVQPPRRSRLHTARREQSSTANHLIHLHLTASVVRRRHPIPDATLTTQFPSRSPPAHGPCPGRPLPSSERVGLSPCSSASVAHLHCLRCVDVTRSAAFPSLHLSLPPTSPAIYTISSI